MRHWDAGRATGLSTLMFFAVGLKNSGQLKAIIRAAMCLSILQRPFRDWQEWQYQNLILSNGGNNLSLSEGWSLKAITIMWKLARLEADLLLGGISLRTNVTGTKGPKRASSQAAGLVATVRC